MQLFHHFPVQWLPYWKCAITWRKKKKKREPSPWIFLDFFSLFNLRCWDTPKKKSCNSQSVCVSWWLKSLPEVQRKLVAERVFTCSLSVFLSLLLSFPVHDSPCSPYTAIFQLRSARLGSRRRDRPTLRGNQCEPRGKARSLPERAERLVRGHRVAPTSEGKPEPVSAPPSSHPDTFRPLKDSYLI